MKKIGILLLLTAALLLTICAVSCGNKKDDELPTGVATTLGGNNEPTEAPTTEKITLPPIVTQDNVEPPTRPPETEAPTAPPIVLEPGPGQEMGWGDGANVTTAAQ